MKVKKLANVEFRHSDLNHSFVIVWHYPDEVAVEVTLTDSKPEHHHEQRWVGKPDDAETAFKTLTSLHSRRLGTEPEYRLRMSHENDVVTSSTWTRSLETEDLAEARRIIEKIGHVHYAAASAYLERGRKAAASEDMQEAVADFRRGIDILGERYISPEVDDDTDMKLLLAEDYEAEDKMDMAANLFDRVLESRLQTYAFLHLPTSE
jgi:hypothetical protein